ncbi:MAG: PAS domain S-box protein [Coleofasciculus sp. G1-WW12-02]|uniref:PAS domain-containing protein n=1 Tax=Coleofasciculus sp. G1-WW12-02 TaxID=3068483 RepID=UPI003301607F
MIAELVNWVDQLQTTLSQMEAALEVITDAVVFLNEDQQIQWSNKAFSSLVNRPQDNVFGSNLIDLLPLIQAGQSVVRESYPDVMTRHGEYETTAYEFQQGDRSLLLQISGHSVTTPQGASSTVLVIQNITQQKQDITERQRAEAALLSSEAQYRDLVQTANCIILRWDHQGTILFLNEYGQRFLGFDAQEIVGCNVVGTIVPQTETSGRDLQRLMVDICQHPENYLLNENENIRKNGQRVWIVWANKPIFDKQGNLVEILSIGTDTTDRREVQAALENSLSLLWAIFESIQDGILAIDYSGNIVSYNQNFLEMWSIPPEVLAEPSRDKRLQYLANQLKNPDEFIQRVRELYAIPEASTCDLLEFKDGRVFERYSCPQRLGTEVVGRVWSFRDITDRKRAEDALQQSELKFRTIVENVNDIIFMLNSEGVYTYVSPNISQILGYTATEIEGKHLTALIHPDDLQICYSDWQKTLALGKQSGAEMRVRHKNGSWRWLSCHTSIVNSLSGGVVLLGVSRDITERKQTEAALERRAQVDSLLSSISRQFIDQDVDTAINFTLKAIAQFIGVERSCIFEYSDDQSQFSLIYEWCADGIQALSSRAQGTATTIVPWFHKQMLSKQVRLFGIYGDKFY